MLSKRRKKTKIMRKESRKRIFIKRREGLRDINKREKLRAKIREGFCQTSYEG